MDENLNSIEKDDLLKLLRDALKLIGVLQKEIIAIKKRLQIIENP